MRTTARRRSRRYGPFRINISGYRISSVTCWWGPAHRKVIWSKEKRRNR